MKVAPLSLTATLALCGACAAPDTQTAIANPAATYCVEQGGTYAIGADGSAGICTLADGSNVDAWEYFRANAPDT